MEAMAATTGANVGGRKNGTTINAQTLIPIGLVILLGSAVFGFGWWGSGVAARLSYVENELTQIKAGDALAAVTNRQMLDRLITIETTTKNIENRLEAIERDRRRRADQP